MSVNVRSGGPRPSSARRVLECYDRTASRGTNSREGVWATGQVPGLGANSFWSGSNGTAWPDSNGANGVKAFRGVSAVNTVFSLTLTNLTIPLDQQLQTAPVAPARYRTLYRHTYRVLAWRSALTAGVQFSMGISDNGQHLGHTLLPQGFELLSLAAVNGGRWTVRRRLVNGGVLDVLVDTGIDPTNNPRLLELRYQESLTVPTLELKVDGVRVYIAAGGAQLPTPPAAGFARQYVPYMAGGDNPGSAVGATDWFRDGAYLLEEL